jgi:CHAT domain-containing protein
MRHWQAIGGFLLTVGLVVAAGALAEQPAGPGDKLTPAQREKLKERDRLAADGQAHENAGRIDEALGAARKILALEQEVHGPAHEEVAGTWEWFAQLYEAKASFAEARQALEEVRKVRQRLYGAAGWRAMDADRALRDLDVRAGLSPAKRQEAARLQREAKGLNQKAMGLYRQGQYTEAVAVQKQSLAMYRKLYPFERYAQGHHALAVSLNELGMLLQERGELGEAEPFYHEALAMYRKLYPSERYLQGHPALAITLNNLGLLLQARGELGQAEPFLRESLAMLRKLYASEDYPQGHAELAMSLNNLGMLLRARGELGQAGPFLRDALAMRRKLYPPERYPQGHRDLAISLNDLGILLHVRGELGEAEPFYHEALAMLRKLYPSERYPRGHLDLARTLNNLGLLLQARGELGQAEPILRESLAMARKLYPSEHYPQGHAELAISLDNLGFLHQARGELGQAEPFLRDALAMRRKLYPPERYPQGHRDLTISLANVGFLHQARGELGQAEPFYRDALVMDQAGLRLLGELYGETEALNFAATLPLTRDAYLSVTRPRLSDAGVYAAVWQGKGTLLRIAARRHDDLLARQDPSTRALAVELGDVRYQLGRLFTQPPSDAAVHRRRLAELTERKEALERAIARELKQQAPPAAGPAPTPDDLRRLLPPRTVFIDFLRYVRIEHDPRKPGREGKTWTPCYVAFVLSKERPAVRVELGPAAPIERAVKDWRRKIEQADKLSKPGTADQDLSRLVWQPLVPYIPAETEVVYLCPDADLTRLPWAALPGREPGRVLLEKHALAVVPHPLYLLEQLQAKRRPAARDDLLVAYGAVRYDQTPDAPEEKPVAHVLALNRDRGESAHVSWPYLGGTEGELEQVQAHAASRKVLVRRDSQASLAQLVRDLPEARWAHLATHGFFAEPGTRSVLQLRPEDYERARWGGRVGVGLRNPLLLSGLVLAGADRKPASGGHKPVEADFKSAATVAETFDPDGGILTGEGLLALPLEHLDLVVLSACETGLGDVAGGEGVFGLQRAFHVCGCKNVIASLWKVNDEATAALMALFYHKLWKENKPPLVALREAQLTLYHHPERIAALAKERGLKLEEVAALPAAQEKDPKAAASKAPVNLWAAFVLSGLGR